MPTRIGRLKELLIGLSVPVTLLAFVIWRAPPLNLPLRETGIVVAIAAIGFLAFIGGNWLRERDEKWLQWIGASLTGFSLLVCASFAIAAVVFIVWAKFNAPSSDCMNCD